MNWRIIIGLALLMLGIKFFYTAYTASTTVNSLTGAKIGCFVWMAAGLFLLVKGMTAKDEGLK